MAEPSTLDIELVDEYLHALFENDYLRVGAITASCNEWTLTVINRITELLLNGQATKDDLANGIMIEIVKNPLLN